MKLLHIHKKLARVTIVMVLTLIAFGSVSGAPTAVTPRAEYEQLQERFRALDKEHAVLAAKVEAQNNRISDMNLTATQHGNHISWTGIAITILVAVAGLITYFSATAKAKAEANQASKSWFDDHAANLTQQIVDLKAKAESVIRSIDEHEDEVAQAATAANTHIQSATEAIAVAAATLLKPQGESGNNPAAEAAVDKVAVISRALKSKPEASFTSADHFTRGLMLFKANNYTGALQSFQDAAGEQKLDPVDHVKYLFAQGVTLSRLDRTRESISVYDTLVQHYGEDSSPGVREQVAKALFNKGVEVGRLHGPEQAIAVYDGLAQRYVDDDSNGSVREQVAKALFNKGVEVDKLQGSERAIAVYDTLAQRYGEDSSPGVREQVAKALVNKCFQISKLHGPEQAIAVCDTLVQRYGEDSSPSVRAQVAKALFNKGVEVGKLHGSEQEVAVYDTLVQRYGEDSSPGVREQVAKALVSKGVEVGRLNGPEQAIAVYDAVVRRYGEDSSHGVREAVAAALINKGVQIGKLDDPEQTIGKVERST